MRPLRGLVACLGTLLLLSVILAFRRHDGEHDGPAGDEETRRSRLRALFSFRTPESFFPPSAIISLTDDNSTFFVARPAAYGPGLPSDGLSGQLWIGSGFGEDSSTQGRLTMNAEGELGCSDIPGWPYNGGSQEKSELDGKSLPKGASTKQPGQKSKPALDPTAEGALGNSRHGRSSQAPQSNDGTDNHLHWPLRGAPLIKGAKLPTKQEDFSPDIKDKEHADIQSIQESAEIAGKVVLLSRGGCGFLEKTKWVQRRGGKALIVGNNVRDPSLVNMYAGEDTSNVTIPSIFTSHMSAHLLSSLLPPGGFINSVTTNDEPPARVAPALSGKMPKKGTKAKSSKTTKQGSSTKGGNSWLSKLAKLFGARSNGSPSPNHRYPASGRISWVQSDNWDEEIASPQSSKSKQVDSKNAGSQGENKGNEDFVIGIHDWRDKDLLALQQEQKLGANTKSASSPTTSAPSETKAAGDAKLKPFSGGNVVPGSGRYSVPGQLATTGEEADDDLTEQESGSWFGRLFNSEDEQLEDDIGSVRSSKSLAESIEDLPPPMPPLVDTPMPRKGLWVTITPTTMSSSPFFDTLLVLVVSPLVTLTVVYALLLLRARIQRRR